MARRARDRIVAHFCAMHGIAPEDAMPYKPQTPDETAEFARLRRVGIVRDVAAGYHWLDREALRAEKLAREQKLILPAILISLAIAATLLLFYEG